MVRWNTRARWNMAGRPGRLGLPRYEGPRPEGYSKVTRKQLKAMASRGDTNAELELEWRREDRALRAGMSPHPERAAKRKPHPPQTTAFAPGFNAVEDMHRGQTVYRLTLHGQLLPTEKMPEGRYTLSPERAAQLSHKLDPETGERLRWGKTKSQRKTKRNPKDQSWYFEGRDLRYTP